MWPFDELIDGVNYIIELIWGIPWAVIELIWAAMQVLVYPLYCLIDLAFSVVQTSWSTFVSLPNMMIDIINVVFGQFNQVFLTTLPPWWITLFGVLLSVRIYQIIWYHLRGVEILGFKL